MGITKTMQVYYTILNVDDDYHYIHRYETIKEAKAIIEEYEYEDIKERDRLQQYHILDINCNPVYDSLYNADVMLGNYIKRVYFNNYSI